jgi:hypothetical protein
MLAASLPHFQFFNVWKQLADFHEIWYGHYEDGGHTKLVGVNFLHLAIRQTHELLRRERLLIYDPQMIYAGRSSKNKQCLFE